MSKRIDPWNVSVPYYCHSSQRRVQFWHWSDLILLVAG